QVTLHPVKALARAVEESFGPGQGARLSRSAANAIGQRRQRLADLSRALPRPEALLDSARQRFDRVERDLSTALEGGIAKRKLALSELSAPLRPNLLRAQVARERDALNKLSARLRPALERVQREANRDITRQRDTLRDATKRLSAAWRRQQQTRAETLTALDRIRQSLGYDQTLNRGYALVWSGKKLVTTAKAAEKATALEVQFRDGRFALGQAKPAPKPKAAKSKPDQGSLF
ncbi:MAG: exodeoxyribonuclease VII large subunit, partial [Pseudomonadota bacterium]